jgi:hypothetical protein
MLYAQHDAFIPILRGFTYVIKLSYFMLHGYDVSVTILRPRRSLYLINDLRAIASRFLVLRHDYAFVRLLFKQIWLLS